MAQNKRNQAAKPRPEKVFEVGDVRASVFVRQTNTGLRYRDYSLSRVWSNVAGKESTGTSFFAHQVAEVQQAATLASEYIRERENAPILAPNSGDTRPAELAD